MTTENDRASRAAKDAIKIQAFDVVMGITQVASLSLLSWALLTIIDHGERLSRIESSRFTSADALLAQQAAAENTLQVWQEILGLRAEVAQKANSADVPPPEVVRWLQRLESDIDRLKEARGVGRTTP